MTQGWLDVHAFRGAQIIDIYDGDQIRAAVRDHKRTALCVLDQILHRFEAQGDYPFLDTKLSLITGKDFPAGDPIRGKGVIYGWIQGRGLEAMAGHLNWLRQQDDIDAALKQQLETRILVLLRTVLSTMETIRRSNGGRLFFMMTREGKPLQIVDGRALPHPILAADARVRPSASGSGEPPTSMSDLFYCKGLAAAGAALGETSVLNDACKLFAQVLADIAAGRFYSDQQPMDARNPVAPVPGRFSHGSRMIGLGACARFLECTGDGEYARIGLEFIDHILSYHVNLSMSPDVGRSFDMWEFVDRHGRPWMEGSPTVLLKSDPGHATEFVGLALKLIGLSEIMGALNDKLLPKAQRFRELLPHVLAQNFANGFATSGFGIVKAYDLLARRPLNDHMPWWNLPETMRAAVEACFVVGEQHRDRFVRIAADCSNAFLKYFVRKELGLMAVQTLDAEGAVIDVVPATPDADPGYHTGLSIIDCLDLLAEE